MTVQHVSSGYGSPESPPPSIGAHYIDLDSGDHYLSRGDEYVEDWVRIPTGGDTAGGGLNKENYVDLIPKGYLGAAAGDYGSLHIFNRKDIGFLIYGGLNNFVAMAPVYEVGIGPKTTFGEYQTWSLGAARCSHVYAVAETGKDMVMGLAPPAGVIGSIALNAQSFGPMYQEIPADEFSLGLTIKVPTFATGDFLRIEFHIAGYQKIELEMDPVTREWSTAGVSLGAQYTYSSQIMVTPGDRGEDGEVTTVSLAVGDTWTDVPVSPDRYTESSGIHMSMRSASSAVVQIDRIGGYVTYADYSNI